MLADFSIGTTLEEAMLQLKQGGSGVDVSMWEIHVYIALVEG